MNEEERALYEKAWAKWPNLQYLMWFEESAELSKAIVKNMRKGPRLDLHDNVCEEIADSMIIIEQLICKYGEKPSLLKVMAVLEALKIQYGEDQVEFWKEAKLNKLKALLDEGTN